MIGGANIFMKRAVFDELKGFTTYQRVGFEDYEFLVRLKLQGLLHTVVRPKYHRLILFLLFSQDS